jgi:hypothetical protein
MWNQPSFVGIDPRGKQVDGDGFACLPVEGAEDLGHPALVAYVVEDVPFSMIRGVVAPVVTQAS